MSLRIHSTLCIATALLGVVMVLLRPDMKEHNAVLLFGIAMIFMGTGFFQVARALKAAGRK